MIKAHLFCVFLIGISLSLGVSFANASPLYTDSFFSSYNENGISPFHSWKTLETEHFRIYFEESDLEIAQRAANLSEEAFVRLSPLFKWKPHYKTPVVLLDNRDLGNGLTAAVGRFGIILWLTPPDSWMTTSYYDDWLRFLIFHEYTHFLNMDPTSGIYAPLRALFLDLLLPNSALPPWMLEGLAVYMETQFSQAGRGRSPDYEMLLRSAVENHTLNTSQFVTLDRLNGSNPFYPSGDTPYQFGYHLMNQASRAEPLQGATVLGELSYRSSFRVPTFINGNLENLIQKNWYQLWQEWLSETQKRIEKDLARIKSKPVTSFDWLIENSHEISSDSTGIAISPDEHWLAYSATSADQRPGLYLRDLKTKKTTHLDDKLFGVGLQFTPDSNTLIFSEHNQINQFQNLSDLWAYDLKTREKYPLSSSRRFKDPDVSRDGKWITFTISKAGRVTLGLAPLKRLDSGRYELGEVTEPLQTLIFDRVSNPKFSRTGSVIYYTLHRNGTSQEDLMMWDRESQNTTPLIQDGFYNLFPTEDKNGDLYFVSNQTGVYNLFAYRKDQTPQLITNFTTGIRFPCFGPSDQLFANLFSTSGWTLAQVNWKSKPTEETSAESIRISQPPAPALSDLSVAKTQKITYPTQNYSVIPSIWPRAILPLLTQDANGFAFGLQTLGFDALDLHRYSLGASYSNQTQTTDAHLLYSNRTLGVDLQFSGSHLTNLIFSQTQLTNYLRKLQVSASLSYPILRTFSRFIPQLSLNVERQWTYELNSTTRTHTLQRVSETLPSVDGSLSFDHREYSRLSIGPEGGGVYTLGMRYYLPVSRSDVKIIASSHTYFRLTQHSILSPSLRAQWSSQNTSQLTPASAILQGRNGQSLMNSMVPDGFSSLSLRGYPGRTYSAQTTLIPALDFRFPITRIFRGLGTELAFLNNLYGLAFAEATLLQGTSAQVILPSAGFGLRLTSELFFIPITFSLESHQGFNRGLGGKNDLFFQFLISDLRF